MISVALDLEPGQVAYFELGGRRYALVAAPEESCLLPSGSGRSSSEGGRYSSRQLADSADDLPAGYAIKPSGEVVLVYYQGEPIGWAGDVNGARGLIERHLGERSHRSRARGFTNYHRRYWENRT